MFIAEIITKNNHYHFEIKNNKNETLFSSLSYLTIKQCVNGIDSFKVNAAMDKRYIRTSNKHTHYFVIKAGNGKTIGNSKLFSDKNDMEELIKTFHNGIRINKK